MSDYAKMSEFLDALNDTQLVRYHAVTVTMSEDIFKEWGEMAASGNFTRVTEVMRLLEDNSAIPMRRHYTKLVTGNSGVSHNINKVMHNPYLWSIDILRKYPRLKALGGIDET